MVKLAFTRFAAILEFEIASMQNCHTDFEVWVRPKCSGDYVVESIDPVFDDRQTIVPIDLGSFSFTKIIALALSR